MALNFAETFLRESGSAQDRAAGMAEMQLRAKQFADQMADQAARTAFAKSEAEARIAQINLEMGIAEETRGFNKRILEAQAELSEYNANIAEAEEKRLKESDRDLTPEEIKKYGVPEGTKLYQVKDVLEIQAQVTQNKLLDFQFQAQTALQERIAALSEGIEQVEQQPIEETEAYQYATEEEKIGFFGKRGRGIASTFLNFITGYPGEEAYSDLEKELYGGLGVTDTGVGPIVRNEEARQKLIALSQRLAKEKELGLTTEAQERIIGEQPISLQAPEIQNLYQQLLLSRQLTGDPAVFEAQALQALIGGQQGLIQGLPPFRMMPGTGLTTVPGIDLNSFMQPPSEE